MVNLSILSINVHGLRNLAKQHKVISWLSQQSYDIFFLQETYFCNSDDITSFKTLWGGEVFYSLGGNHSCGVAILFKRSFSGVVSSCSSDQSGRLVNVSLNIGDSCLQLVNIYAPCPVGARAVFFSLLSSYVRVGLPTIFGGDFNCVEDLFLDKVGGDSQPGKSALDALSEFNSSFGLSDVFRSIHPSSRSFTWSNGRVHSRIDKFYVSQDILQNSKLAGITIFPFSDHDAPFLIFNLPFFPNRGRGLWKFNTTLLESPAFVSKMEGFLLHWKRRKVDFIDKLDAWWDIGKKKIRKICQKFSLNIARNHRRERKELEERIQVLSLSSDEGAIDELARLRSEILALDLVKINGARIRAKELHLSCNEKSSRYFFHLENKRQARKVITKIKDDQGSMIEGNSAILGCIASFYQKLYSEEVTDFDNEAILLASIEKTLPDVVSQGLEESLTSEECLAALNLMKPDKSPGSDGFPAEFYKSFWQVIGDDLVEMLNFCFARGLLSESMRIAILSLIHKKNDPCSLKNWRPISLLNVDYKIGTKALASRLKRVLPLLLNSDQTCSVPGRSIFENLMLFRDVFDYCDMKDLSLAIVKIDQEKAFDRVSWPFLLKVLTKMNFGTCFINFIKTLYNDVSCKISNNGHLSSSVTLKRGVRQGCPLSPLLYCLVAETLGNLVRQNHLIAGLRIPGGNRDIKISQYADDTTLFLSNGFSIDQALLSVNIYELGSGSRVNYDIGKSCGKWLSKSCPRPSIKNKNLLWTNDSLEILGLTFGSKSSVDDSWRKRIDKLSRRLDAWSFRSLSLKGRALIINSIAISGLVYVGSVFRLSDSLYKSINRIIFKFLWADKNELVARKTCFLPIHQGGLGIVDINVKVKALHLKHVANICNSAYSSPWVFFARYFIGLQFRKYLPASSFLRANNSPHSFSPSLFYQSLLSFVNHFKDLFPHFSSLHCSTRSIYTNIFQCNFDSPVCELSWMVCLGKDHEWKIPWPNSRLGLSSGFENDVLWKIYHRVLKTAFYLKSWGLRISDQCNLCSVVEDIDHVFFHCPSALAVWEFIRQYIVSLLGVFNVSPEFLFFFEFPQHVHANAKKLSMYLIKLSIHQIWYYRCESRYGRKVFKSVDVIASIRSLCRQRIKLVFQAKGKLSKEFPLWSFRGILCRSVNDRLFFDI